MLGPGVCGLDAEKYFLAKAASLPFADQSFDLVFSNSVIEHVGSRDTQARFASEIARVGKLFWLQTPNRYFPIEQHLWTPLVHWLPRRWQGRDSQALLGMEPGDQL